MSEINTSYKNEGRKHLHKVIKVDLTPIVDLGFLLMTFFILTTTLQEAHALKLVMPKDSKDSTKLPASATLTFILSRNDSIGYYEGMSDEIKFSNFGSMRNIIRRKQIDLTQDNIDKNLLTLILKPLAESSYKNLIDALDEITIADCRHYFITEATKEDTF